MIKNKAFWAEIVFAMLVLAFAVAAIIYNDNKGEDFSSNYETVILKENPGYQLAVLTVKNSYDEPQAVWCEMQSAKDGSTNAFVERIDFWSRDSRIEYLIEGDIPFGGENYVTSTVNTDEEYSYFVFKSSSMTAGSTNIYQHGYIEF